MIPNHKAITDHVNFWKGNTILFGISSLIILPACFGRTILFLTDQSIRTPNYFNGILIIWVLGISFLLAFISSLKGFRLLKKHPELIGVHPNDEDLLQNGLSPDSIKSCIKSKYLGILFGILLIMATIIFVLLILPQWLTYDQRLAFSKIFNTGNVPAFLLIVFSPAFIIDGVISLKYGINGGLPSIISVKKIPIPIPSINVFEPFQVKKYGLFPPYCIGHRAKVLSTIQILIASLLIFWSICRLMTP